MISKWCDLIVSPGSKSYSGRRSSLPILSRRRACSASSRDVLDFLFTTTFRTKNVGGIDWQGRAIRVTPFRQFMSQFRQRPFVDLPVHSVDLVKDETLAFREQIEIRIGINEQHFVSFGRRDVFQPSTGFFSFLAPVDQVLYPDQNRTFRRRYHAIARDRLAAVKQRLAVGQIQQLDKLHVNEPAVVLFYQKRGSLSSLFFVKQEPHIYENSVAVRCCLSWFGTLDRPECGQSATTLTGAFPDRYAV